MPQISITEEGVWKAFREAESTQGSRARQNWPPGLEAASKLCDCPSDKTDILSIPEPR